MDVQGSCHCGRVTLAATVDPASVTICHCTDCQNLTGTAYRVSVPVARADFRLLSGEPAVYVKVGDTGSRRAQAFCSHCGSPLFTHAADEDPPATYGLRVGCLAQRRALAPTKQKYCDSALPWALDIHALPGTPRG